MTETPRVLGQSAPVAATLTAAYTVPAATNTVVSSIVVCNRSATPTTFRISVAVAGAVDATSQYLFYDAAIGGNGAVTVVLGVTLAATDVVRVYATLATLSFSFFGVEVT